MDQQPGEPRRPLDPLRLEHDLALARVREQELRAAPPPRPTEGVPKWLRNLLLAIVCGVFILVVMRFFSAQISSGVL